MSRHHRNKSRWAKQTKADGTFDFESLSAQEKEAFFAEAEAGSGDRGNPLTSRQRLLHAEARRVGGRRKHHDAQTVSVSIEKSLLKQADQYAKEHEMSRSDLFTRGLRKLLRLPGAA